MKHAWITIVVLGLIGAACGDGNGNGDQEVAKAVFESCTANTDCDEGLFCAQGGPMAGHCALACAEDGECASKLGDAHFCYESVCVGYCGFRSSCTSSPPDTFTRCSGGLVCRGPVLNCRGVCAEETWGDGTVGP